MAKKNYDIQKIGDKWYVTFLGKKCAWCKSFTNIRDARREMNRQNDNDRINDLWLS